jgi:hypothetical protein
VKEGLLEGDHVVPLFVGPIVGWPVVGATVEGEGVGFVVGEPD